MLNFKTIVVGSVARSTLLFCPEVCSGFFYAILTTDEVSVMLLAYA